MALKALLPLGIMGGAVFVLGEFTGSVGKLRNYHEHSLDWEQGLKHVCGVIPPRTRIDPFLTPLHPALKDREIPIYTSGAMLSQIVPGGPLDPYANPKPTKEAIAKENARLAAYAKEHGVRMPEGLSKEDRREIRQVKQGTREQKLKLFKASYRNDPMAEHYRVIAYQLLHPELTIDEAKKHVLQTGKRIHEW